MIQQNVIVEITGTNDGEITFSSAKGLLIQGEDFDTVSYEEKTDDEGSVKTDILIGPEKVSIKKSGDVMSEMIFEAGKKFSSKYVTPYGVFPMEIVTKNLIIYKEEKISASIDYLLVFGGADNNCNVKIEITKEV